jgi:hypothetical protein
MTCFFRAEWGCGLMTDHDKGQKLTNRWMAHRTKIPSMALPRRIQYRVSGTHGAGSLSMPAI